MPWENPTHEDSDPVTERKLWLPVTVLGKSGFAAHFLVTGLLLSLSSTTDSQKGRCFLSVLIAGVVRVGKDRG